MTTLLGPLDHDQRPYFVTVIDEQHEPLLMLGWTPHEGKGSIGEESPGRPTASTRT
jgi:hypothetical protein